MSYISPGLVKFKVRLPPTNSVNPPRNVVQFSHKAICPHYLLKFPKYVCIYVKDRFKTCGNKFNS